MPGPKMGPRPRDFDEELVRRSPTFRKWECLSPGRKLRYACRDFVKGQGDDEERLMRRIMIARRNNVRDHQALKWARRMQSSVMANNAEAEAASPAPKPSASEPLKDAEGVDVKCQGTEKGIESSGNHNASSSRIEKEAIISRTSHLLQAEQDPPPGRRSRRPTTLISDEAIKEEMDVAAVESTRSYKTWLSLPNGAEFLYNQKYIKGHEAHDWLLKKNIWRRMRYRRENKKMVEEMLSRGRGEPRPTTQEKQSRKRRYDAAMLSDTASGPVASPSAVKTEDIGDLDRAVADAAMTRQATLGMVAGKSEINRQEVVASTASEIVDHALLSTNTGAGVPAQPILPSLNATAGDTITISIGDPHRQQQFQDQTHPANALHQHHPTESATAFAASIALAGVGIGTDGDLNSHHEAAVADSAAIEAALAVAPAYHHQTNNNLSHQPVNHHGGLMEVNHVVHGGSDAHAVQTAVEESTLAASQAPDVATASTTRTVGTSVPDGVANGLGLALDAAAKLAAAAAVTGETILTAISPPTVTDTSTVEAVAQAGKDNISGGNGGNNDSVEI